MTLRSKKQYLVYPAVVGLLVFFHYLRILSPVESAVSNLLSPIFNVFYSAGTGVKNIYNQETDKRDLAKINQTLENEVNRLVIENSQLKYVEEENKILRQALDFLSSGKNQYKMANVVSRGGDDGISQVVIIDRGEKDGLYPGLGVIDNNGALIGKIMNVKSDIAEVYLTTHSKCRLAATLQNSNRTGGIVNGRLGLTVEMEFIPQTELVKIGDTVVSSNIDPNMASGYLIGKVIQVNQENNEIWQSAIIEPMTDMDALNIVSVVLPIKK